MNAMSPTPRMSLAGVDWQRSWEELEATRPTSGNAAHWNKRSTSYGDMRYGDYEQRFFELAQIAPGSTVLDFGCGVGLLAVPLAKQGCRVIACDFSQGMLDQLAIHAREAGVEEPHRAAPALVGRRLVGCGPCPRLGGRGHRLALHRHHAPRGRPAQARRRGARARVRHGGCGGVSPPRRARLRGCGPHGVLGARLRLLPQYPAGLWGVRRPDLHCDPPPPGLRGPRRRPGSACQDDGRRPLARGGSTRLAAYVDAQYVEDPTMPADRTFAARHDCPVRWAFISWGAGSR